MTLEETLKAARTYLHKSNIEDGNIDAWYLLSYYFSIKRAEFLLNPTMQITEEQYDSYMELVKKRGSHIPLQHITGEQEFMGLNFKVSEDVLIPRQDTEILVEEILKVSSGKDVLDLCTGSGCIIISLDKLGSINKGVGVDISEKALIIANQNAVKLNANVQFIQSDLFDKINETYDIIVSNPPYIPTTDINDLMEEVKNYEPIIALDGEEDGLYFYRTIINEVSRYLRPDGYVFFEIGYNQGNDVSQMLKEHGFYNIKVIKDLAGLDRVVSGQRSMNGGTINV